MHVLLQKMKHCKCDDNETIQTQLAIKLGLLVAMLRGSRPGVQSASLIMTS